MKSRGLKVVFYPFLLGTGSGEPWRGRITYSPDISSAATSAVNAFLGSAAVSQFTQDTTNLTVAYSGSATDWTYRRMILHYANLCAVAGGVNLFVIGSELRGLETIRGPSWTNAGTTDGSGYAIWDYPFVAGLVQLASDVRTVFNTAGLTKSLSSLSNLITYSGDWSSWMGYQHPGANGQWPHLDQLWASSNIDVVSFDNYLPLSDWTTGSGGLDVTNWSSPVSSSWPPATFGLGLNGSPTLYSKPYLKANIEGGEKFSWYYSNGTNGGAQNDPLGSALIVSQPQGDRATQTREVYYSGQQILANKQMRWWWNNLHYAVYSTGSGWVAQGPHTEWVANSKPIIFLEYGFPCVDKGTNQPNLFYSPTSNESGTPYWSIWDRTPDGLIARRDDTLLSLALQAVYEYWNTDTPSKNANVGGVPMLQTALCCVWAWDARPFPTFPQLSSVWGDAVDWATGNWLNGRGPLLPIVAPSPDPTPGSYATFPTLATLAWSVHIAPKYATHISARTTGRELRNIDRAFPLWDVTLTYNLLRANSYAEFQTLAGFYENCGGAAGLFWFSPPGLSPVAAQVLGAGNGVKSVFPLVVSWLGQYSEPVLYVSAVSAVYWNGISQSGWSVSSGYAPQITFTTPPGNGVVVTADFSPLWLCRFAEDVADFENFMALLWQCGTLKLQTVRP